MFPQRFCPPEQSVELWCCAERAHTEFVLWYSRQRPLPSEIIWKTDYLAKYFLWLFCVCFCSEWARCKWLKCPVVADTRQMLHPRLSAWLHNWEVKVCAYCGTRIPLGFSWEYKMEKNPKCCWDTVISVEWKCVLVSEAFVIAAHLPWDSWAHPDLRLCSHSAFVLSLRVSFSLSRVVGFILTSTRLCFHAKGVSLVLEPLE